MRPTAVLVVVLQVLCSSSPCLPLTLRAKYVPPVLTQKEDNNRFYTGHHSTAEHVTHVKFKDAAVVGHRLAADINIDKASNHSSRNTNFDLLDRVQQLQKTVNDLKIELQT